MRVSRACRCCSPSPLAHARPSEARGTTSPLTVGAADGPVKVRNMLCGSQFGASGALVVVLHEQRLFGRRVEVGMESAARRGKEGEAKVKNENVHRDLDPARGTHTFLARRSRCPKSTGIAQQIVLLCLAPIFASKLSHNTNLRGRRCGRGREYSVCERMGMSYALVLHCRARRR